MSKRLLIAAAAATLVAVATPALADKAPVTVTQDDVGPPLSWEEAVAHTEAVIKAQLIDPDSAKFEWPYQFSAGAFKSVFSKVQKGYLSCGTVNSKNRMGGYTGRAWFMVVFNHGSIIKLDLDDNESIKPAEAGCREFISSGFLVPVPLQSQASVQPAPTATATATTPSIPAPPPPGTPVLGFNYAALPDGAYIGAITPKGAAETAGLKQGMVITAVNGIPLKGMDLKTMQAIFGAANGDILLSVVGQPDMHIKKAPIPAG